MAISLSIRNIQMLPKSVLGRIWQPDMLAATVILGLMPTIISYIGPTVEEISLVPLHRPFFTLLIASGAPAVHPIRSFSFKALERA